jgi:hypothetical protein
MHQGVDPKVAKYWGKGHYYNRGIIRWIHAPQKILKIRCPRLAKNAFAIQHLLHHSVVYTFIHYRTMNYHLYTIAPMNALI